MTPIWPGRDARATREELAALMDKDIFITGAQAMEYGLIDEIVGAGAEVADPAAFVAAAGSRIRLTQAMREGYQSHVAGQRAEAARKEQAERILARLRVLERF